MAIPTPSQRSRERSADTALHAGYEIVIVGSGVAAAALAFALAQRHGLRDIAVLKPPHAVGVAPGPAVLRQSHEAPAMVALASAAVQAYRGLPRALRAEMSPLVRPLLELAFTPAGLARANRLADTASHLGGKAWLVPPLEVRSHLPFARLGGEPPLLGALFEPAVTVFDRRGLARALTTAAAERGVQFLEAVPVEEVLFEGDTAIGVRTTTATVRAKSIVLAPEGALPRFAGLELPGLAGLAETLLIESEPAGPAFAAVAVSRRFGTLAQDDLGCTALSAIVPAGREPSAARVAHLAALVEAAPGLGGLLLRRELRSRILPTLDGAPIAGRLRPGLHLLAGLGFENAALALPAAEALAGEIAGGAAPTLLAPLAPARFAAGRLLAAPAGMLAA